MQWLLRTLSGLCGAWALALFAGARALVPSEQITPTAVWLGLSFAAMNGVFALAFWRASSERPPNRTVIYSAIILLMLKTAADLWGVLRLFDGAAALVTLADLTLSVALCVGIIEALPGTLRPPVTRETQEVKRDA